MNARMDIIEIIEKTACEDPERLALKSPSSASFLPKENDFENPGMEMTSARMVIQTERERTISKAKKTNRLWSYFTRQSRPSCTNR